MNAAKPAQVPVGPSLWLRRRIHALRGFSLPVSVLPVLVATAAACPWSRWKWDILAASVAGVALLHAAGNLLNDYFDFLSGVDRKVTGDEGRPGRLLVRGELGPRDVLAEALVCLLLAAPAAAYLTWKCGPGIPWFGGAAALALYAYTGPPLRMKYRALGEVLIFLVFGPLLMLGAAYAQTGTLGWPVLLLSVPVGLATTAVLVGNNIRDSEEDSAAGILTLVGAWGVRAVRLLYLGLIISCAFGLVLIAAARLGPLALMAAPVLLVMILNTLISVWRGRRLPDIDMRTARFESVLLLFLLAVLVLNGGM